MHFQKNNWSIWKLIFWQNLYSNFWTMYACYEEKKIVFRKLDDSACVRWFFYFPILPSVSKQNVRINTKNFHYHTLSKLHYSMSENKGIKRFTKNHAYKETLDHEHCTTMSLYQNSEFLHCLNFKGQKAVRHCSEMTNQRLVSGPNIYNHILL